MDWDTLVGAPVMSAMGDTVSYRPHGQTVAVDVAGAVFDEAHYTTFDDAGNPSASVVQPVVGVRLALLPAAPVQGDAVYIGTANGVLIDRTYAVADVQPDGVGWALLMLNLIGAGRQ